MSHSSELAGPTEPDDAAEAAEAAEASSGESMRAALPDSFAGGDVDASGEGSPTRPAADDVPPVDSAANSDQPLELVDSDFLSVAQRPVNAVESSTERQFTERQFTERQFTERRFNVRFPGPGLPEACAWTVALVPVQVAGAIVTTILLVIWMVATGRSLTPNFANELESGRKFVALFGGIQLFFVIFAVMGCFLRLGMSDAKRRLVLSPMTVPHLVLLFVLVLPLILIGSQLHTWLMVVWQEIVEVWPWLSALDRMHIEHTITGLAESASFPVLVLILAVSPAIAEELVFRGIIGRGLTARWGLPLGMFFTSCLFAIVHMHPAHVLALLPLAGMLHFLYFMTRSFWAPVLLHFLNNAFAAVATKYPEYVNIGGLAEDSPPPILLAASVLCVISLVVVFWKTRVEYRLADGTNWTPGYTTVESPPAGIAFERVRRTASRQVLTLGFAGMASLIVAWAYVLVAS